MRDYPQMIAATDRVEPAPRRVRAVLAGKTIVYTTRPGAARVYRADAAEGLADTERVEWSAPQIRSDDDQVQVHPRSRSARVVALRSSRSVRVDGKPLERPTTHFSR